ncbi:MAG: type 2 isopentenyl-diphosphate Delta-isomerase [Nitrososphaerota archaeon]|jgi:isopentenyl-diphosphate delta-isomerase|nr:type 2 isopentenyl-diphosphate Delta-isomerase [Nitrososphaerota archaeon]
MPDEVVAKETQDRKVQHINIILNENTQYKKTNMMELVEIEPNGGEIDPKEVDTGMRFMGRDISAPVFISGMTGGHPISFQINRDIAEAASRLKIPMGVGSQRAMLEKKELAYTYDVKKFVDDLILIGNMGASRLGRYSHEKIQEMLDIIKADAFAIHTNPGQESVQPEGDLDFRGVYDRIVDVAKAIRQPVVVKEVGNGISKEVAASLRGKVHAIDVQGAGGTTWIGVETYRSKGSHGMAFWEWGIPTALSLLESKSAFDGPVWASGGIRDPIDIVKGIAMGAEVCGMAKPVIVSEREGGSEGVFSFMSDMIEGVRREMGALGFSTIDELRNSKVSFINPLKSILEERGIKKPGPVA